MMKKYLPMIALAVLAMGCKTTLESGGAYNVEGDNPQLFLYKSDLAFERANAVVDIALKWEYHNRALLWSINPSVKHELDKVRMRLPVYRQAYYDARQNYVDIGDLPFKSELEVAVSHMTTLETQVTTLTK